jgi:hypothetical protein
VRGLLDISQTKQKFSTYIIQLHKLSRCNYFGLFGSTGAFFFFVFFAGAAAGAAGGAAAGAATGAGAGAGAAAAFLPFLPVAAAAAAAGAGSPRRRTICC